MRENRLNSSLFQLLEDGQPRWLVLRRSDGHYDVRFGDYRDPATKLLLRGEGWVNSGHDPRNWAWDLAVTAVYGQGEVGAEILNELAARLIVPVLGHLAQLEQ